MKSTETRTGHKTVPNFYTYSLSREFKKNLIFKVTIAFTLFVHYSIPHLNTANTTCSSLTTHHQWNTQEVIKNKKTPKTPKTTSTTNYTTQKTSLCLYPAILTFPSSHLLLYLRLPLHCPYFHQTTKKHTKKYTKQILSPQTPPVRLNPSNCPIRSTFHQKHPSTLHNAYTTTPEWLQKTSTSSSIQAYVTTSA